MQYSIDMLEVARASHRRSAGLVDREAIGSLFGSYLFPVMMAGVFLVSLPLVIDHATALRGWSSDHAGAGTFIVESCTVKTEFAGGQWRCGGWFTTEGATQPLRTTLASPMEAWGATQPYVGEQLESFHATGDRSMIYPNSYWLNEMTRVYLALIPRLLVLVGASMWLVGWFLTRDVDAEDRVTLDAVRLPQRFGWQARALNWFVAAGIVWAINYLLVTRITGSLGIL